MVTQAKKAIPVQLVLRGEPQAKPVQLDLLAILDHLEQARLAQPAILDHPGPVRRAPQAQQAQQATLDRLVLARLVQPAQPAILDRLALAQQAPPGQPGQPAILAHPEPVQLGQPAIRAHPGPARPARRDQQVRPAIRDHPEPVRLARLVTSAQQAQQGIRVMPSPVQQDLPVLAEPVPPVM